MPTTSRHILCGDRACWLQQKKSFPIIAGPNRSAPSEGYHFRPHRTFQNQHEEPIDDLQSSGLAARRCQMSGIGIQRPDAAEDHAQHMGNHRPTRPMIQATATAEDATRDAATIKMILYLSGSCPRIGPPHRPKRGHSASSTGRRQRAIASYCLQQIDFGP